MPRRRLSLLPIAASLLTSTILAQKPIAHYSLQSDLKDSAGTNHGTFEGKLGANASATFVPDSVFGSVLSFDGTDDRINLGPVHKLQNSSWTISFWINTTDKTTTGLIGKNNGDTGFSRGERVMEITGPNSWGGLGSNRTTGNFAVNGHTMAGVAAKRTVCKLDVALNDGAWHLLTVVHDDSVSNTHLTIYIDGALASSVTGSFDNNTYPEVGNFYLGFSNYSGNNGVDYLAGKMAEVNFFSRAITKIDLLLLHAVFFKRFVSDSNDISVAAGGSQNLRIDAGRCLATRSYWIFGSLTGTSPGTKVGGLTIPLNIDPYTTLAMGLANTPVFAKFRGTLDAKGSATASLNVPANQPIPIGIKLYHACVVFTGPQFLSASNPVQVTFIK
jgi:hypothetical protein